MGAPPIAILSCNIDSDCAVRSPTFSLSTILQEDTSIGTRRTDFYHASKSATKIKTSSSSIHGVNRATKSNVERYYYCE